MFQKLRPLGDRVLVKRLEDQEATPAGIIIPDAAKEKAQTGSVVAVGTGRRDKDGNPIALEVKTGDVIYFGKYAGTEAGEDHLIIKEDEILGIVEK
jgi:chaperonin GroES